MYGHAHKLIHLKRGAYPSDTFLWQPCAKLNCNHKLCMSTRRICRLKTPPLLHVEAQQIGLLLLHLTRLLACHLRWLISTKTLATPPSSLLLLQLFHLCLSIVATHLSHPLIPHFKVTKSYSHRSCFNLAGK